MTTLAALITVYHRIDPAQLTAALDSLVAQTRPADETVIVIDGPISGELERVVDKYDARVVRLSTNQGAGPASQAGLEAITADWVARLDADDIARRDRFERQLAFAHTHPNVDVIGTAMAEFAETPGDGEAIRTLPESHAAIARYAKLNSPVNNPSVMIRRTALLQAGGYQDVHHMEDYDLYARLLATGAVFANLAEPLTYFRVSPAQFARRTDGMAKAEWQMQRNLVSYGLISRPRAILNFVLRMTYRALPKQLLVRVYSRLFHR